VFLQAAIGDAKHLLQTITSDPNVISAFSSDGFTPLHLACFFGQADTVDLLVNAGAPVNIKTNNSSALSPLHSAAASQSILIVRKLLSCGADVDVQQAGGYTALMSAAAHNNSELLALLQSFGANLAIKDDAGKTAFDHGYDNGYTISSLKSQ
ncbi:MAG: ankyrin repeat domain-containing protein, partial [Kangiellaceae bacterium]|nr:ankyrin repeat domain-containing protein [Kangiellaceae bacterium]